LAVRTAWRPGIAVLDAFHKSIERESPLENRCAAFPGFEIAPVEILAAETRKPPPEITVHVFGKLWP
jgi:hypothetical protein